jgi:hypothetical protein
MYLLALYGLLARLHVCMHSKDSHGWAITYRLLGYRTELFGTDVESEKLTKKYIYSRQNNEIGKLQTF